MTSRNQRWVLAIVSFTCGDHRRVESEAVFTCGDHGRVDREAVLVVGGFQARNQLVQQGHR